VSDRRPTVLQGARRRWVQRLCPSPRRYLQDLAAGMGLETGIDLGCGETSVLAPLRATGFRSVGIDLSLRMARSSRARGVHDRVVVGSLGCLADGARWDVVVLSHVIEHVDREDGLGLLRWAERAARHLVYVETPHGFLPQPAAPGNPYQRHLSGWFPWDFQGRGYRVFGMGVRGLRGIGGGARLLPETLTRWVERAAQRLVYRRPSLAGTIAAIRLVDRNGDLGMF